MTKHRNLSNSELHEDKGVAAANDRELYWSNGSGSGEWKPLIYTTSHTVSGTESSIEFTGLGEFVFVQVDLFNIQKNTSTDHSIIVQLGNDSGYTTSSVYYQDRWDSASDNSGLQTGLEAGWFKDDTGLANSGINCSTLFITNFNIARYTIATSSEHMINPTTFNVNNVVDRMHFVREQVAYNKLRLTDNIGASFTGGTVVISGWRHYTE